MKKINVLFLISLFFIGCSFKPPKPIELDGGSNISINQGLIIKRDSSVPEDPFLKEHNWTYNINFIASKDRLIPDDLIVKTFYLAQNASKIIIVGYTPVANRYKEYFLANGVRAKIIMQPVDGINLNKNQVNVLFFHTK